MLILTPPPELFQIAIQFGKHNINYSEIECTATNVWLLHFASVFYEDYFLTFEFLTDSGYTSTEFFFCDRNSGVNTPVTTFLNQTPVKIIEEFNKCIPHEILETFWKCTSQN
ncbi:hypothetical protein CAL7716_053470 [Calothrix sp. PCC 7716]|nr:hypothetical protein CAL7716_053470 [Calothrix sp. PCC 7716]